MCRLLSEVEAAHLFVEQGSLFGGGRLEPVKELRDLIDAADSAGVVDIYGSN